MNEVRNEILSITNLATNSANTAVENKIPDHSKYITAPEFNTLTAESFTARLKADITDFVKKADFDSNLKNLNKKVT